jgi:spermidine synthase
MSAVIPAVPIAPARLAPSRLAAVALIVFVANAGLLVLQLTAARLLVPFIGSSLETWTAIIGVFLGGIALGNAAGGSIADRAPTPRALTLFLLLGAAATVWMMQFPRLLADTGWYLPLPLGLRIPILAVAMCFPVAFVLSLLTPMAIKLGLPDVRRAGRAAGMVFAIATLGCLAGNYAAGFYLIPTFTVDTLIGGTAGVLVVAALGALVIGQTGWPLGQTPAESADTGGPSLWFTRHPSLSRRRAYAIVFLASFGGMALELTAARILAQVVGVSLYTWTGVIGVMLAGTACGNWLGGVLADRAGRHNNPVVGANRLAASLILAALAAVLVLIGYFTILWLELFRTLPLVTRILTWTFALFFLPMMLLGTISPQVIRLTVPDVASAGRVAGRVYAWSTAGAIVGTFATGYVLISTIGMYRTVLVVALAALVGAFLVVRVWERRVLLYGLSIAVGAIMAGYVALGPQGTKITKETNYYTIRVVEDPDYPGVLRLLLDVLIHSWVRTDDPSFLFYEHEQIQMEFLRAAGPDASVLVIGGGGYTFPRAAKTEWPGIRMDVVEIDPGVTEVSYTHLGLDPNLGITTFNMDGRRFVVERAVPGTYNLVTQDAVNDFSVPYHLLTKEFNEAVKQTLAPGGVYLATVIDTPEHGKLWRAALHTLRQTFRHVELLIASAEWRPGDAAVLVLYAADHPLDLDAVRAATRKPRSDAHAAVASNAAAVPLAWFTHRPPPGELERLLAAHPPLILTDQFAPVDNLMANEFRQRR